MEPNVTLMTESSNFNNNHLKIKAKLNISYIYLGQVNSTLCKKNGIIILIVNPTIIIWFDNWITVGGQAKSLPNKYIHQINLKSSFSILQKHLTLGFHEVPSIRLLRLQRKTSQQGSYCLHTGLI